MHNHSIPAENAAEISSFFESFNELQNGKKSVVWSHYFYVFAVSLRWIVYQQGSIILGGVYRVGFEA